MFRKEALARLSSPEELDQVMHVTSPRGWITLLALGLVLLGGLAWSVLGSIPTVVAGSGALLTPPGGGPLQAVVFVPLDRAASIAPGMPVRLQLPTLQRDPATRLLGTVRAVDPLPADSSTVRDAVGNDAYAQALVAAGNLIRVQVDLQPNPAAAGGYRWSTATGAATVPQAGLPCTAGITVADQPPISFVIP